MTRKLQAIGPRLRATTATFQIDRSLGHHIFRNTTAASAHQKAEQRNFSQEKSFS